MADTKRRIDPPEVIGERIKKERNAMLMTQEELGEHLGRSTNYIGQLERGTRSPSLDMADRIASFFGVSLDYLIYGEDHYAPACMIQETSNYESNARILQLLNRCTTQEKELCEQTLTAMIISLHSRKE